MHVNRLPSNAFPREIKRPLLVADAICFSLGHYICMRRPSWTNARASHYRRSGSALDLSTAVCVGHCAGHGQVCEFVRLRIEALRKDRPGLYQNASVLRTNSMLVSAPSYSSLRGASVQGVEGHRGCDRHTTVPVERAQGPRHTVCERWPSARLGVHCCHGALESRPVQT